MTVEKESAVATPTSSRTLWSVQETGHYVATLHGVTLGHVVTVPDGSFIAFDGNATPLGRHHTIRAAQLSTLRAAGLTDLPAVLRRLSLLLATITGACALMLLTAGVLVLSATP